MKVVLFGGTFNPVHSGHVKLADYVISVVKPDKFFVIPAYLPPHKFNVSMPASMRLELCNIGFASIKNGCCDTEFCISDYEIEAGKLSYSINTIEHFRNLYPKAELYFVCGSDVINNFHKWHQPDRILQLANMLVAIRTDQVAQNVINIDEHYAKLIVDYNKISDLNSVERHHGHIVLLTGLKAVDVSSTIIRDILHNNENNESEQKLTEYIDDDKLRANLLDKAYLYRDNK